MSGLGGRIAVGSAAVALLCTSCGGGGSSSAVALPKTTSSATGATQPAEGVHGLVGECHRASRQALRTLVDRSHAVPCSRPHNVETVGVHPVYSTLTKANTYATVNGYRDACWPDFLQRLKLEGEELNRLTLVPLAMRRSDGQWVVRCDVYVQAAIASGGPAVVTRTSLRSQALSGHTATWTVCTDVHPREGAPLVDCTRPHRYQAAADFQTLTAHDRRYPTPGQLRVRGRTVCRDAIAERPDASRLTVQGFWTSRRRWVVSGRPSSIYGSCYFSRTDGRDLPAVR